jgi:hypothetical protein
MSDGVLEMILKVAAFLPIVFTVRPQYALDFSQPLTEMSTRSRKIMFMGNRAHPVRRGDNLTVICEPIV